MDKNRHIPARLSRRDTLKVCLLPAASAVAARWLAGCSDDTDPGGDLRADASSPALPADASAASPQNWDGSAIADAGSMQSDAASTSSDTSGNAPTRDATSGTVADAASTPQEAGGPGPISVQDASADAAGSDAAVGITGWASGGTKSMQGGYPDPFMPGSLGSSCTLYPSQTLGPCYARMPATREDISGGLTGLPMRLSFLVVGSDGCTPVPNASVDIWHSGSNGIYSAFRTNSTCNPSSMDVLSETFCRGVQVTRQDGRADFSTVFPGWYTGRTLHIHFTVRVNGREYVTSQLYFEDALADEILAQGEYKSRGMRDTNNARDTQFKTGGATPQQVIFSTAKRADGVLHAWKVLSVRGA